MDCKLIKRRTSAVLGALRAFLLSAKLSLSRLSDLDLGGGSTSASSFRFQDSPTAGSVPSKSKHGLVVVAYIRCMCPVCFWTDVFFVVGAHFLLAHCRRVIPLLSLTCGLAAIRTTTGTFCAHPLSNGAGCLLLERCRGHISWNLDRWIGAEKMYFLLSHFEQRKN